MAALDWAVILAYFVGLFTLAWWVFRQNKDTAADYFLANRNLGWFIVGASIFASNIGSEHLVGLAGSGATSGVALAHYELHAWCLLVLGWVFVPFYARSMVYTMPEFLEKRYSPGVRTVMAIFWIALYIFVNLTSILWLGATAITTLTGIEVFTALVALAAFAAGLRWEDIPRQVRHEGKRALLNMFATALAGPMISTRAGTPSTRPATNRTSSALRSSIGMVRASVTVQSMLGDGTAA